jgi:hypothetical protein
MKGLRALLIAAVISTVGSARAEQPLEEIVEKTLPFSENASLSIKNIDGSIRVYGSDDSEIRIQAVKKAYSTERLNGIEVNVQASAQGVTIDTVYPPKKTRWSFADQSGIVDYTIVVPHAATIARLELVNGEILVEGLHGGGRATAILANGRATTHNCFADLDFSVENGGLELYYDWWEQNAFVFNGVATNANIKAGFPPDAEFIADATTTSGRIVNRFSKKKTARNAEAETASKRFHAAVGTDLGPVFNFRTMAGSITIDRSY